MSPLFSTESLNAIAPDWLAATRAALVQGFVALAFVAAFWALFRRHLSHAFAHGLFLIVPVKTAAAFLFVAWPVAIAFSVPLPQKLVALIHPPEKLQTSAKMALTSQIQPLESLTTEPRGELVLVDAPEVIATPAIEHVKEPPVAQAVAMESKSLRGETPISAVARLMIAWALGVSLFTFCFLANHLRMMRRLHLSQITPDAAHQAFVNLLAVQMKMRRTPLLLETPAVATPAVIGLFRPKLLVPEGFFTAFSTDETRWALLHELAHLRRRDLCWLAFERAVGLALFFHPALWVARHATRFFRELACDDLAQMQSGLSPRTCAETFLKLVIWSGRPEIGPNPIAPTLSLTNRYPAIQQRIMNMTEREDLRRPARLSRGSAIAMIFLAILVSLPYSPRIAAQASAVGQEIESSVSDNRKTSKPGTNPNRPNDFAAELTEIQKLSEELNATLPKIDSIKPIDNRTISDKLPPHDGNLIDFPNTVNAPDIILVEVLQAFPGRPIAGERTVQPDGTISLGFYGRLHVSGLNLDQIKTKVLIHLRQYLDDEALGLVEQAKGGRWKTVEPHKSTKVLVDVAKNNSQFYYVTGAVQSEGRFPIVGKETVMDAIAIAKGLKDDADLDQFILIRPQQGPESSKRYIIDWRRISVAGDNKSNLQIFPGDRLIVQKKISKDSASATKPDQTPDSIMVEVPANAADKTNDAPSFHYRGKVLLPDGSPAAHTRVGFSTTRDDFPLMQGGIITGSQRGNKIPMTDALGQFELQTESQVVEWLVPGHKVSVRQPGQSINDKNPIVLQLQPSGGIQGRLLINGNPNSDTTVSVLYLKKPHGLIIPGHITTVGGDGKYEFQGLIPGSAILEFRIGQPGSARPITRWQRVEIRPGEMKKNELNLKMAETGRSDIYGKIRLVVPDTVSTHKDVTKTTFDLRPLPGNPLRIEKGEGANAMEIRAKYLETAEGMALNNVLEEFGYVPRHLHSNFDFRLTDVPYGKYELVIHTFTHAGALIGSVSKTIDINQKTAGGNQSMYFLGEFVIDQKKTDASSATTKQ